MPPGFPVFVVFHMKLVELPVSSRLAGLGEELGKGRHDAARNSNGVWFKEKVKCKLIGIFSWRASSAPARTEHPLFRTSRGDARHHNPPEHVVLLAYHLLRTGWPMGMEPPMPPMAPTPCWSRLGKEPMEHWTLQTQAPFSTRPMPSTTPLPAPGATTGVALGMAMLSVAAGGRPSRGGRPEAAGGASTGALWAGGCPPVMGEALPLPFWAMAMDWNMA